MEKRIRRLGIFMLLCFIALFVQLNNIQVVKAKALATSPQQPPGHRGLPRPAPRRDPLGRQRDAGPVRGGHQRVSASTSGSTPPNTATLFAQIVGLRLPIYGKDRRRGRVQQLPVGPHHPGQDPAGPVDQPHLLRQRDVDHQLRDAGAGGGGAGPGAGGSGRRRRGHQPHQRGHPGHVLQPDLRPEPAGVPGRARSRRRPGPRTTTPCRNPLLAGAYDQLPAGLDFKAVHVGRPTTTGPALATHDVPADRCISLQPTRHRPLPTADQLPGSRAVRREPRAAPARVVRRRLRPDRA